MKYKAERNQWQRFLYRRISGG